MEVYKKKKGTYTKYHPFRPKADPMDSLIEGWELQGNRAVAYGSGIGNNRVLQARQLPVRSVVSLYENIGAWDTAGGSWPAASLLVEGNDFQIDYDPGSSQMGWTGFIFRRSGSWSEAPRSIKLTYVAGLTAAELDVTTGEFNEFAAAALLATIKMFNEFKLHSGLASGGSGVGPVTSESLGPWSISYGDTSQLYGMKRALPAECCDLLEDRMRYGKYLGG